MSTDLGVAGLLSNFRWRAVALLLGFSCSLMAAAAIPAFGQEGWPREPILLVAPSSVDEEARHFIRLLARALTRRLGMAVLVDYAADAGTGSSVEPKLAANDHTFVIAGLDQLLEGSIVAAPLAGQATSRLLDELEPVLMIADVPYMICVNLPASVGPPTGRAMVGFIEDRPGAVFYGSRGHGTGGYLAGQLFQKYTGTSINHRQYRGDGLALRALLTGEVQFIFSPASQVAQYIPPGKVRPAAVTSWKRTRPLYGVPTTEEQGIPGFEISNWVGLFAYKGTPKPIIQSLTQAATDSLHSAELSVIWESTGSAVPEMTGQRFAGFVRREISRWQSILRNSAER